MIVVDDFVIAALAGSHIATGRITASYADTQGEVDFSTAQVTFDENVNVQGRCTVTLPVPTLRNTRYMDPRAIDVSGWRLFLEYGVYIGGSIYWVPIGTFVVYDLSDDEGPQGRAINITGYDTTVLLRDGRFELPYSIASGTNYKDAMTAIIEDVNLEAQLSDTSFTTPALLFQEGDVPLDQLQKMASSCGTRIEADPFGTIVDRAVGTLIPTDAVIEFVEGPMCRMTALSKQRTRQRAYSAAVVVGEPAGGSPVYARVVDSDPNSTTYYDGPFGHVPVFEKSQFVATQVQADNAALALLLRKRGIGTADKITTWTDPRVRPGDLAKVVRSTMGIDRVVPLRSVSLSLKPGANMTCVTRDGTSTVDE